MPTRPRQPYRGYNIDFIAQYLYEKPGARSGEIRDALARSRGMESAPPGWLTDYFYRNRTRAGGTAYAGRLWERVDEGNPRRGWRLCLEGYARVRRP